MDIPRFEAAFCSVFVFQPVLQYLKLEFADRADILPVAGLLPEKLCQSFLRQLFDPFFQLFALQGVQVDHFLEYLG